MGTLRTSQSFVGVTHTAGRSIVPGRIMGKEGCDWERGKQCKQ